MRFAFYRIDNNLLRWWQEIHPTTPTRKYFCAYLTLPTTTTTTRIYTLNFFFHHRAKLIHLFDSYKREVGRKLCSFNANCSLWWCIEILITLLRLINNVSSSEYEVLFWLVNVVKKHDGVVFQVIVVFVALATVSGVSSVPVPQQYNDIHHDQQQYRTSPVPILKHNYQQLHGGYQYRSVTKKKLPYTHYKSKCSI